MTGLSLCPVSLAEANRFVGEYHRHHNPLKIHKFSVGCSVDGQLVGVAIVARPVARPLDDGLTLEVARLCTDGTRNACSLLYSAAWRAARAMGYRRIVTYILASEQGASLRAAGWNCAGLCKGHKRSGKREDLRCAQRKLFDNPCPLPPQNKLRYEKCAK
jgi:hypothetical protein